MPIFKIDNKLLLFIHIPKAGGTSLEKYLESKSTSFGFIDTPRFKQETKKYAWYTSTPQHLPGNTLDRLFHRENFFDDAIVISREPVSRFISAFNYHKYEMGSINKAISINYFVQYMLKDIQNIVGKYDNHFMPMTFFLPKTIPYKKFKLEEGMDEVVKFLSERYSSMTFYDQLSVENRRKAAKKINWFNFYGRILLIKQMFLGMKPNDDLTDKSKSILREVYRDDYHAFGYEEHF